MNLSEETLALIITGGVGLLLVIFSIILLLGKGSFLIAGYNTMPQREKDKYDSKALCRFTGKILLPIGVLTPFLTLGAIYNIKWLIAVYVITIIGLVTFSIIYCNTNNRFKK